MEHLEVISPAKLNLFFEILGQREDGYHEIETVMQTVSVFDTIQLFKTEHGVELTTDADWLSAGPENFACRAAELFFKKSGIRAGVRIHIRKRTPAEAGLGGGSSNCAAVLTGLNTMFRNPLDIDALSAAAAQISSDAPFFLSGGTAVCRGRGEKVDKVDVSGGRGYIIAVPPLRVSTALAYSRFREKGEYPGTPRESSALLRFLSSGEPGGIEGYIFNRLQETVLEFNRELNTYKQNLERLGGGMYFLTGSGSALFRPVETEDEGLREIDLIRADDDLGKGNMFYCRQF